jgi:hypothetical protein
MEDRSVIIKKRVESYLDTNYGSSWRATNPSVRLKIPWSKIATQLTGLVTTRSGDPIKGNHILEIWINQLDPRLNRTAFTTEELNILKGIFMEAKKQGKTLGSDQFQLPDGYTWSNVLPLEYKRSPNDVKNVYYANQRYWSEEAADPVIVPVSVSHALSPVVPLVDNGSSDDDISPDNDLYKELFSSDPRIRPLIGDETPTPFAFDFDPSLESSDGGFRGKVSRKVRKSSRKAKKSSKKSKRKARKSSRK